MTDQAGTACVVPGFRLLRTDADTAARRGVLPRRVFTACRQGTMDGAARLYGETQLNTESMISR